MAPTAPSAGHGCGVSVPARSALEPQNGKAKAKAKAKAKNEAKAKAVPKAKTSQQEATAVV